MADRETITRTVTTGDVKAELLFMKRAAPRWINSPNPRGRGWMSATQAEYNKKPRVYVSTSGETLLDNLMNRTTRPVNVWGRAVRAALAALDLPGKVGWSPKAGCSMCPCSPGFIWTGAPLLDFGYGPATTRYDVWVTLADAPKVREDAAAQLEQLSRLGSIAQDPTLPLESLAGVTL